MEGSRSFEAGGGAFTPSLELGLRHDGGDAETRTGVELGAGVRYAGAGVTVEGSVRTLLTHDVNRHSILTPNRRAKLTPLSGTAEVVPVVNRGDPRGFV